MRIHTIPFVILLTLLTFGCENALINLPPEGTIDTPNEEVVVIAGSSVAFSGSGDDPEDQTALSYHWSFEGAAEESTQKDPGSVVFKTPGVYIVRLTVSDNQGLADPTPAEVQVNVVYYFSANDGKHGWEVWRTDGTEAGTDLAKDIIPGSEPSAQYREPANFTLAGNTLFLRRTIRPSDGISGKRMGRRLEPFC